MSSCVRELTKEEEQEMQIREMQARIGYLENKIERLSGVIEGLKFSIRCNGVSGNEVTG